MIFHIPWPWICKTFSILILIWVCHWKHSYRSTPWNSTVSDGKSEKKKVYSCSHSVGISHITSPLISKQLALFHSLEIPIIFVSILLLLLFIINLSSFLDFFEVIWVYFLEATVCLKKTEICVTEITTYARNYTSFTLLHCNKLVKKILFFVYPMFIFLIWVKYATVNVKHTI